jgi:ATP-dependent Clp protease protease subunit
VAEPGWEAVRRPVEQALFDRRILVVSGHVDAVRAGELAASLMTLDALGDDPIEMRLSAESDSLDAAFCLIDTVDVLGVAINATVGGYVGGTLAGVLAVCRHRRIGRHGYIRLREPSGQIGGPATHMRIQAADMEGRLERFCHRLADATNRPFEHVEADVRRGRNLDAPGALAYGLVDEILEPGSAR